MKRKEKRKRLNATPEESRKIFGPGCFIDWENNTIYGADGNVYRDVKVSRKDVDKLIAEYLREKGQLQ
jgi:hypothetical protein